ncbi:MAG: tyrosine-protein phosphatase [Clostridia bacterium]|nr:tyrosine-protein phosphatase [Clostridia bacterium]
MKHWRMLCAILACLFVLPTLQACKQPPEESVEQDVPQREEYCDLSDSTVPLYADTGKKSCTVQSTGQGTAASVDMEALMSVAAVKGNCFYRSGAAEAVANEIAARLTEVDIAAQITVTCKKYKENTSAQEGSLFYGATVVLADGTEYTRTYQAAIPAVAGAWLDTSEGGYGSTHDARGQWQETFDPSGMLFLTDNKIACAEGIVRMEYAVIGADAAFDAAEVVWHKPQHVQMCENGFASLLINAPLDLHGTLTEGQQYRLLVRGVSLYENYVLHVDIPFTYSPLSVQAQDALAAAYRAVANAAPVCDAAAEDKAAAAREQLCALINNPDIEVAVELLGQGVQSARLSVSLRYVPAIDNARLPAYVLDGETIADVFNYSGAAFATDALTLRYGQEETGIALTAPYDGEVHVVLANELIYAHAKAPLFKVESVAYGDYVRGEYCTPLPVRLAWTDANASAGKVYTVSICEREDMQSAMELTVEDTFADVYNLKVGTQYYWQVRADGVTSLVHTFTTESEYPRFIKLDGVSNVRDIGGYVTLDGKVVKQGLAFRSAHLDGITEQGLAVALGELGIRTDLDLRQGSFTPLGESVQHISIAMQWYNHIFERSYRSDVRKAISAFAYEENYPMVFHCSMGRDRTGTTAFLILGLLGVDEDTLRHEYYASFFSAQGAYEPEEFEELVKNMNRLTKGLNKYGDDNDTLQEKIEAYLLSIGVTKEEIQSIRDILLEE